MSACSNSLAGRALEKLPGIGLTSSTTGSPALRCENACLPPLLTAWPLHYFQDCLALLRSSRWDVLRNTDEKSRRWSRIPRAEVLFPVLSLSAVVARSGCQKLQPACQKRLKGPPARRRSPHSRTRRSLYASFPFGSSKSLRSSLHLKYTHWTARPRKALEVDFVARRVRTEALRKTIGVPPCCPRVPLN